MGVVPAVIVLVIGLVPYLVALPAYFSMFLSGDRAVVRSAIVLNGTMIGGVLGIIAILMAYGPEKLRGNPKRKRIAIIFGCAGLCAEVLYFASGGVGDVSSHLLARCVMLGPLIVGAHCAYRVFGHSSGNTSSAVAVR